MNTMHITQDDVNRFAQWSGDRNPIHVNPDAAKKSSFGGTIAHGALTTIEALRSLPSELARGREIEGLDIEFRGEVRPDRNYPVESSSENETSTVVTVSDGQATRMTVTATYRNGLTVPSTAAVVAWMEEAMQAGDPSSGDDAPVAWQPYDFEAGACHYGRHRFGHHAAAESSLTTTQEKVLGLCSFIVGMKAPGLSSLFTRLSIDFAAAAADCGDEVAYRLTFRDYEPHFRLLETELEIASASGELIATARVQSYVRFPQAEPDPAGYVGELTLPARELASKVALVCGASRGLGAELAAALGAAKCKVYLACRHPNESTRALVEQIDAAGGAAVIVAGDVGDAQWCERTKSEILAADGRLDLLFLNACAAPRFGGVAGSTEADSFSYIAENLALSKIPLASFLSCIAEVSGAVVAISSSFVDECPAGFADYIGVKMAVEGLVKTAAREHPKVHFLIARPPKLRTSWNDTPTSAMGAIPTAVAAARIINTVASPDDRTPVEVLDSFPFTEPAIRQVTAEPDRRVVLCSTFTLDPIGNGLQRWSAELDLHLGIEFAPYAQVLQQCLDPASLMSRSSDGAVILIRVSDWLREWNLDDADAGDVERRLRAAAQEYIDAIKTHRSFAAGPTLLLICPGTVSGYLLESLLHEIEHQLRDSLSEIPGLTLIETRDCHALFEIDGTQNIFDELRDEIAHIPYQDAYYFFLSALIARFVHRQNAPTKKVIVLDCDNTLWGGVVGEVGAEGVRFDEVHHQLHRRLLQLAESGMLLCLCSKNEEHDVWSVFDQRSDFGIPRDQIVAAAVNWLPKSQNIQALAERLNLGLDSFIFLDDNPVECAEVRSGCPSVLTIQWPTDAASATKLLDHFWELEARDATAEDKRRTQLYREEFSRQDSLQSAGNFQEFIDSLDLNIDIQTLSDADLARASQLTLRTNQFNFTTLRRSEAELKALMADPNVVCQTVRVRDRFGDYGLVGFLIGAAQDDALLVDTFLLSCRVLGRGVEHHMAANLGKIACDRGLSLVNWRHVPTDRNTPARSFLGLVADAQPPEDAGGVWECGTDAEELSSFHFQAAQADTPTADPKPDASPTANQSPTLSTRDRERQIERIAQSLSTYAQLEIACGGELTTAEATPANLDEIVEQVTTTFAKALRRSTGEIAHIDRLEALGCDSLRIVEITVALSKQYPWLPKTLLFEHRSVSEIIAAITEVASGQATRQLAGRPAINEPRPSAAEIGDIAIVGIGVRCAGADTATELWSMLTEGRSAVVRVPVQRDSSVGMLQDERDHFAGLVAGAANFDAEFFGVSPREAEYMDPQLRIVLENAWHALEDAGGLGDQFDVATGVFVGVMYSSYGRFANAVATQTGSLYRCWEGFSLANRLSQVLGCNGPSLSIDTACSSSATALHYACRSLADGDCSTAVVSGVNLIVDPNRLVQLGRLGILSPSGRCVPFGDDADGTVMGEGAVSVVLRPLAEAQRRGDRVYAVIKGTGISSGAGSVGFTAPNPTAQAIATRRAIVAAGVDPRTIGYIETHGTGTELGDPIEVRGLEMAYCAPQLWQSELQVRHQCTIGSIKPNVGHLEAGAGLMGLIKTALQLHHRTLVPSLTSDAPNPQIPFGDLPFDIQRQSRQWESISASRAGVKIDLPRRAGVNSFGVGGSNVHVILEEPDSVPAREDANADRSAHLLTLSATSTAALRRQAPAWTDSLTTLDRERIADVCYSANVGRKHHPVRAAIVISNEHDAAEQLQRITEGLQVHDGMQLTDADTIVNPRIAFLFTGQGAQYPTMMHNLYQQSPVFRAAFDECANGLDSHLNKPLHEVIFSGNAADREHCIHQTGNTQPALFAIQYSLWRLWKSWGIEADVMLGHSIGEVAAYCVAGGCSLQDALHLVVARGRLMQALPAGGTMASIGLDFEHTQQAITGKGERISIAAMNGPMQTVISGTVDAVNQTLEELNANGVRTTPLSVSHAFHSALMEPMLDEFADVLRGLSLGTPRTPIVSSATGQLITDEMSKPEYWLHQARNPVRFVEAMNTLHAENVTHYVELGPHPVMLGMGRECLPDVEARWMPSARRGADDWSTLLDSLGRLYVDGLDVDWAGLDMPYSRRRVATPGYQFDPQRMWLEELENGNLAGPRHDGDQTACFADPISQGETSTSRNATSLTYQLDWQALPRKLTPSDKETGTWLVLADHAAAALEVAAALTTCDLRCIPAVVAVPHQDVSSVPGPLGAGPLDSLEVNASTELVVCLSQQALSALIQEHRGTLERIVYADSPPTDISDETPSPYSLSTNSVFQLSQVVAAIGNTQLPPRCVWMASRNAICVNAADASALRLSSSPLWGFARVAVLEHSSWWGGSVDLDALEWKEQINRLVDEIRFPCADDQIVLRAEHRFVPRLRPRNAVPTLPNGDVASALQLDQGCVLITGGLGGIGLEVANWLAEQGARHLLLSSRSKTPSAAAQTAIARLRQSGVQVSIVAADISTSTGIDACRIATSGQPLIGIVHAAGVDLRKPIADTSYADVESLLAAKVNGTWRLHNAFDQQPLQFFVCISSIAAVWGSAERSLYAAANSFLDAFAHYRRGIGKPALSINFGPWHGAGMADRASLAELSRIGNDGLDANVALQQVADLLAQHETQAVVADIDWARFRPVLESRRPQPLFAELGQVADSCQATSSRGEIKKESTDSGYPWIEQLQGLSENERHMRLADLLKTEVARLLRIKDPQSIALDGQLFDLGMDSLTSAELVIGLRKQTGVGSSTHLLANPTIRAIATTLMAAIRFGDTSNTDSNVQAGTSNRAEGPDTWISQLAGTDEDRTERLVALLTKDLSRTLGRKSTHDPSATQPLVDLGLDSLGAVEFANRIRDRLQLNQSPRVLDFLHLRALAAHLVQGIPAAVVAEIIGYSEAVEPALSNFLTQAFPDRPRDLVMPRWKWMFLESAQRLGVDPQVWLFQDGDKIVGHHGAQLVRFEIRGKQSTTAWLIETMVLESHRDRGVGTRLVIQSLEDMPFNLSLGQTENMRAILENLGWKRVAPLQTYLLAINPGRVLKGKLHPAAIPAASAWMRLRGKARRMLSPASSVHATVRQVTRYDARHDRLWEKVSGSYGCATVRDASFLNWKYVDQPGQSFTRLEILIDDELIACAVISIAESAPPYHYRRAFIVDLVVSTDPRDLQSAIHKTVEHCQGVGVDAVTMHVINNRIEQALESYGFLKRPSTRHLLIATDNSIDRQTLLEPHQWLITQGDSDIDRP
ncbi:type I polyketide synthase [Allorhodopirellula heiligendammensis]|uniref:Erythronolide synthase, modules 1 and 2 n=1 Tax=Allorhodopirellula heiligendammensis TaxID=2714739 RepID=A0A5C6C7I9_9BACT|nr:type I polyketide synthase [Allorhodopirellula heiligendammensis]TWU19987.1 Erythronolide synthase, modules 1 and 2 [Allorhodopirellula heiligendammensis]